MMKTNRTYRRIVSFLLTGLGVASLALSCGKIERSGGNDEEWNPLVGDVPLRIRTSVSAPGTKAAGTAFENGDKIGIFGFYHDGSGDADGSWAAENTAGTNIPDYMYNQLMTFNVGSDAWDYSPVKYWPNENRNGSDHIDKLSFWGYYPYNASGLSLRAAGSPYTNTSTGIPDLFFDALGGDIDLMTSDLAADLYKGQPRTPSDGNYGNVTDGEVQLGFHHRLSKVVIQGKSADALSTIYIKKLSVKNVKHTGTRPHEGSWSLANDIMDYTPIRAAVPPEVDRSINGTVSILSMLFLLPQATSESGRDMVLEVEYYTEDPAVTTTSSCKLSEVGPSAWEEDYQYTYTLSISGGSLSVKCIVADWDDGGTIAPAYPVETDFSIVAPVYKLYDLQGYPTDWVDAYAAVAYGYDQDEDGNDSQPLYSPLLRLISTSGSDLKLKCDNPAFEFVTFDGNGHYARTGSTTLTISAGTDVETLFYLVPTSADAPSRREASVFLTSEDGFVYYPYNVSVFPGNADNTACYYYFVSEAEYKDAHDQTPG